jgi:hypothetical protein
MLFDCCIADRAENIISLVCGPLYSRRLATVLHATMPRWCEMAASLLVSGVSWLVSEWVRGLLRFGPPEVVLLDAGS